MAAVYCLTDLQPDLERCLADAVPLLEDLGARIAAEHFPSVSTA
jgi:glycerate kinase